MRRALLIALIAALLLGSCAHMSDQDRAYMLMQKAVSEHWGKDWEALVSEATKAIELAPYALWPYSVRGAAHGMMGRYEEAFADINRVLDISPDYEPALANRGILYMRLGQRDRAEEDLSEALLYDADDVAALVAMAGVMSDKGDLLRACSLIRKAVEYGYRDMPALYALPEYSALTRNPCLEKIERYIEEETLGEQAAPSE